MIIFFNKLYYNFFLLSIFLVILSCGDSNYFCEMGEMRCSGDTVQLCNADHEWIDWMSCWRNGLRCYQDPDHCGGTTYDVACCD